MFLCCFGFVSVLFQLYFNNVRTVVARLVIITAVEFVGSISAVIVCVAAPALINTRSVATRELVKIAIGRSRHDCGMRPKTCTTLNAAVQRRPKVTVLGHTPPLSSRPFCPPFVSLPSLSSPLFPLPTPFSPSPSPPLFIHLFIML